MVAMGGNPKADSMKTKMKRRIAPTFHRATFLRPALDPPLQLQQHPPSGHLPCTTFLSRSAARSRVHYNTTGCTTQSYIYDNDTHSLKARKL